MHRLLAILPLPLSALAPARAANTDELLEPDKAFRFSAQALEAAPVEVRYALADGSSLYRERFRCAAEPATVRLGEPRFSKGQIHEDKFFGKQEIYRKEVRIRLPLEAAGADRVKLRVTSQGCADVGVCYVPQVQTSDLRLASAGGPRSPIYEKGDPFASSPERVAGIVASEEMRFAGVLESGRLWAVMAGLFCAGLVVTCRPFCLSVSPLLFGINLGQRRKVTRGRPLLVSLPHVLAPAVTYTAIGIAAALSG